MSASDHLSPGQFVPPLRRTPFGVSANPASAGQLYHGTNRADLDQVHAPGGGMNFFTPHYYEAASWARRRARSHGGQAVVYPVQPTGPYREDPNSIQGYRSEHPLQVSGRAMAAPDTAGMREIAKHYSTPAMEHGPLLIPRDRDETYWRDDWSSRRDD